MLLAQDVSTSVTVVTVGMVITAFGAVATSLFSWLSARDKLRFDASVVEMQANMKALIQDIQDCANERDAAREKAEKLDRELRAEIRELRDRYEAKVGGGK